MTRLADLAEPGTRLGCVSGPPAESRRSDSSFALALVLPEVGPALPFPPGGSRASKRSLPATGRPSRRQPTSVQRRRRDWHWLIYDLPAAKRSARQCPKRQLARQARSPTRGEFRNGCSLFPSSGVGRAPPGRRETSRKPPDSTAVALSYGPYGGGHGHPDKLNLVLYAQGRQWLPHFGSMPYESTGKAEWTSHTVSHNTVVVDGISQRPAGQRDRQWPVDNASDRVIGKLEHFDPASKLVAASCDNAYEGITLRCHGAALPSLRGGRFQRGIGRLGRCAASIRLRDARGRRFRRQLRGPRTAVRPARPVMRLSTCPAETGHEHHPGRNPPVHLRGTSDSASGSCPRTETRPRYCWPKARATHQRPRCRCSSCGAQRHTRGS